MNQVFNGNKLLENRALNALNWGCYLKDTTKEDLLSFIFLYKNDTKIKTMVFDGTADDYARGIEILQKEGDAIDYDQYVIGYESNMLLGENNESIAVIIAKAFDRRQDNGVFVIQKFKVVDSVFSKIGNPTILDSLPMQLSKIATSEDDILEDPTTLMQLSVTNSTQKKDIVFTVLSSNESEISHTCKLAIDQKLRNFKEDNLSGNFELYIQTRHTVNSEYLAYMVLQGFQTLVATDFVQQNFVNAGIKITLTAEHEDKVLFTTDSTLLQKNTPHHSGTVYSAPTKKWWEFWK